MSMAPQGFMSNFNSSNNVDQSLYSNNSSSNLNRVEALRSTPLDRKAYGIGTNNLDTSSYGPSTIMQKKNPRLMTQTPSGNQFKGGNIFETTRRTTLGAGLLNTVSRNAKVVDDPRPIKSKEFMNMAKQKVSEYLTHRRFPKEINLDAHTGRFIEDCFKFLYARLDPFYTFGRKFEDDIYSILKNIKYPYLENLTKSKLRNPASVSSWPEVLAFLVWLTELNLLVDKIENDNMMGGGNESMASNSVRFEDKVFYEYLINAYPIWLNGNDEPTEIEQNLENQFLQKSQIASDENSKLEAELGELQDELAQLENHKSPLQIEEEQQIALEKDMDLLGAYKKKLELLISKTGEKIEYLDRNNELLDSDNKIIDQEIEKVNAILNEQKISIVEVGQMNSEKMRLSASLDENQQILAEKQKEVWMKETDIQKFLDTIESVDNKYNESVSQIDFSMISDINAIPTRVPNNLASNDIVASDIHIRVNLNSNDPSQIVQPPLKPELEKSLGKVRELVLFNSNLLSAATFEISEENIKLEDIKHEMTEKINELTKKCDRLQKDAEFLRSTIIEQSKIPSLEINSLENEIQILELSIGDTEQQAKESFVVCKTNLEYIKRTAAQYEDILSRELVDSLDEVLKMQNYVRTRLAESAKIIFMD
ncbi:putative kinetochore protein NDC80 [Smittium culicis]|uniref:Kinetochore protein NDC80 n=1 Tax=Smittium culicis TaxID=133412 RepID=A0A1R1YLY5_9FUNG|nr:putative kinetochore protein NDC80 [Smittium culicis]